MKKTIEIIKADTFELDPTKKYIISFPDLTLDDESFEKVIEGVGKIFDPSNVILVNGKVDIAEQG